MGDNNADEKKDTSRYVPRFGKNDPSKSILREAVKEINRHKSHQPGQTKK